MFADADEYTASMQWVPNVKPTTIRFAGCTVHISCKTQVLMEWHLFPKALQMSLWGDLADEQAYDICPNAWYSARHLLTWALKAMPDGWDSHLWAERYGHSDVTHLVKMAFDRYHEALAYREQGARTTPVSVDPEVALCSRCGGGFVPHLSTFVHHCQNPKPWLTASDSAVSGPYAMRKAAREEAEGLARSASPTDSGSGCA